MGLTLLLLLYFQAKFGEFLAMVSADEALVILDEIECLCNPWFGESRVSFQLAEDRLWGLEHFDDPTSCKVNVCICLTH